MHILQIDKKALIFIFIGFIILLIVIFSMIFVKKYIFGSRYANFFEEIIAGENIFNMQSYYSEYDLTIYQYGKPYAYFVQEWHEKGKQKFKFADKFGNTVIYITNGGKITIEKSKDELAMPLRFSSKGNLISINTVLNVYYELKQNAKVVHNCSSYVYKKDDRIVIVMESGKQTSNECQLCLLANTNDVEKIVLELDREYNPLSIIIYDNPHRVKSVVVYRNFRVNIDLSEDMFK